CGCGLLGHQKVQKIQVNPIHQSGRNHKALARTLASAPVPADSRQSSLIHDEQSAHFSQKLRVMKLDKRNSHGILPRTYPAKVALNEKSVGPEHKVQGTQDAAGPTERVNLGLQVFRQDLLAHILGVRDAVRRHTAALLSSTPVANLQGMPPPRWPSGRVNNTDLTNRRSTLSSQGEYERKHQPRHRPRCHPKQQRGCGRTESGKRGRKRKRKNPSPSGSTIRVKLRSQAANDQIGVLDVDIQSRWRRFEPDGHIEDPTAITKLLSTLPRRKIEVRDEGNRMVQRELGLQGADQLMHIADRIGNIESLKLRDQIKVLSQPEPIANIVPLEPNGVASDGDLLPNLLKGPNKLTVNNKLVMIGKDLVSTECAVDNPKIRYRRNCILLHDTWQGEVQGPAKGLTIKTEVKDDPIKVLWPDRELKQAWDKFGHWIKTRKLLSPLVEYGSSGNPRFNLQVSVEQKIPGEPPYGNSASATTASHCAAINVAEMQHKTVSWGKRKQATQTCNDEPTDLVAQSMHSSPSKPAARRDLYTCSSPGQVEQKGEIEQSDWKVTLDQDVGYVSRDTPWTPAHPARKHSSQFKKTLHDGRLLALWNHSS
ncbi:hypothetical protein GP486_007361, partial [Trichoglossum hirsutum]